jgi:hypothetical protein
MLVIGNFLWIAILLPSTQSSNYIGDWQRAFAWGLMCSPVISTGVLLCGIRSIQKKKRVQGFEMIARK